DGVTTNPSLVAKEKKDFKELVKEICSITPGHVSAEVLSITEKEMIEEARSLSKIAGNVVVKIPFGIEGLKAVKTLSKEGVKCNVTLVFSVNQALLAAKAGAFYTSIFVGRLDDLSQDGMQVVRDTIDIYSKYGFGSQVLAASIRHPLHVIQAAQAGAHVATIPFGILKKMYYHPLTESGLKAFLDDWNKARK
ncbi:MAG: fructose-6-phosphate aldolase, partial [Candidatus Micrarchaeota archaeon]